MQRRLTLLMGALVFWGVALAPGSTARAASTQSQLTSRLVLSRGTVSAGDELTAELVVSNTGPKIDLTKVAKVNMQKTGCRPRVGIELSQGANSHGVSFASQCSKAPFVIDHGVTRITLSVTTSYLSCYLNAAAAAPSCFPQPIPPGKWKVAVRWSEAVPVPTPRPAVLRVTS